MKLTENDWSGRRGSNSRFVPYPGQEHPALAPTEAQTQDSCLTSNLRDDCPAVPYVGAPAAIGLPLRSATSVGQPSTHEVILPLFQPTPTKKYRTLVADPPWHYDLRAKDETHRARVTYGTMSQFELLNLPVGMWANDDAHLYLWVTNNFMVEGHALLKAWGFEYKTMITWVKGRREGRQIITQIGMGNYFRSATEHILFATRGHQDVKNHGEPNWFLSPRREHSQKPEAFFDMVQRMSPGPYLDVFSRQQRLGWDTWGNECFIPDDLPTPEDVAGGAL